MANNYTNKAPGIYTEDSVIEPVVQSESPFTAGFIGTAQRGKVGVPTFVSSWDSYLREFAQGVESPFTANSDLAYAVYGFFQNGGKRAYISRASSEGALQGKMDNSAFTNVEIEDNPEIFAIDAGPWSDNMKISEVKDNEDIPDTFDLSVLIGTEIVETFSALSNDVESGNFWIDVILGKSKYITPKSGLLTTTSVESKFDGGIDNQQSMSDGNYIKNLKGFDVIDDVNILVIPGQTSAEIRKGLGDYVENRADLVAMFEGPQAAVVDTFKEIRKEFSCLFGGMVDTWVKVIDPLSNSGKFRNCPASGHVIGAYARSIADSGVWKAAAGTSMILKGVVDVVSTRTSEEIGILNGLGIICLTPKPNYGIVIWGARSLNPDPTMRYMSDVMLDVFIKKSVYNSGQPYVFESNDVKTWSKVQTAAEAFLDNLWRNGGLAGASAEQAYYVRCDGDLNPQENIDAGLVYVEVGYAQNKPSEFIIFKYSHTLQRNV